MVTAQRFRIDSLFRWFRDGRLWSRPRWLDIKTDSHGVTDRPRWKYGGCPIASPRRLQNPRSGAKNRCLIITLDLIVAADVAADVVSRSITLSSPVDPRTNAPDRGRQGATVRGGPWRSPAFITAPIADRFAQNAALRAKMARLLCSGQEPRWQTPSRPCEPPRPAWVPVELPGLGRGTDE